MPLIDLWKANREELFEKQFKQLISLAGDGKLVDGGGASSEIRGFLRIVPTAKLVEYAHQCLEDPFECSGLALQDIVNEMGLRLGFSVEYGRYRGVRGHSGHDGLWTLIDHRKILVEVKTTDVYQIDIDTFANYRRMLADEEKLKLDETSILMVVGRNSTNALEAQIRGSRYAWDIRLISVDALIRLVRLKEALDDPLTSQRIAEILLPKEYTRVDEIIDLVFTTAEEVAAADEPNDVEIEVDEESGGESQQKQRDKAFTPVQFHDACAELVERRLGTSLVRESKARYLDQRYQRRVLILVSKLHAAGNYWFAFHPYQKDLLEEFSDSRIVLACGSPKRVLMLPLKVVTDHLVDTWKTVVRQDKEYWHIRLKQRNGEIFWNLKKGVDDLPITEYVISWLD